MDSQRPFLYITLVFLGFLLWVNWQSFNAPPPKPTAATATMSTPDANVVSDNTNTVPSQPTAPEFVSNTNNNTAQQQQSNPNEQLIRVRTDVLDMQISTMGGDFVVADLPTYPVSLEQKDSPVRILDRAGEGYVAQSGLLARGENAASRAPTHQTLFSVEKTEYTLEEGQDELIIPLLWQSQDGVQVTKLYRFKRGHFDVDVEHRIQNKSTQPWSGTEYRQLQHGPVPPPAGGFLTSGVRAFVGGAYYADGKYQRMPFDDMAEKLNIATEGGWVSMLEHYFISAWIPPQDMKGSYYTQEIGQDLSRRYILGMHSAVLQVAPGQSGRFYSKLWVGPKLQDDLEVLAKGLDLTVDYGIFAFISKPIFWVMQWIYVLVGNWGWTIIFLTLLIKLLFFWPSAASYKSMAKVKAVAPKLKEINDRYANDPQGKQKAMMEIYRKEKINPLGGCLPILIQIPVFMGLYWVLLESVELRQASWLLWYQDLSIRDPYFVLPIIMGVSMFVQQKLNPPPADPMQQKIFQFLPLIFTFMFLWFPAGLVLYWVVNNILSIAQQWFINNKIIGKPKTE